ncbi:MAG TPA: hypothetical protein VNL97_08005 [Solirubrobacterales bacterium]|jgi:hypothetical protein|nr:hypothetical protein [Solirubrobacterales bacterium]
MVDEYTIVKSIHVLAAALWVGAGLAVNIAMTLGARSGEPSTMLVAMRFAKFLGTYVFPWLSLITLAFGIWLTESFYSWDLLWIQLGMAGLVVATAIGILYLGPKAAAGIAGIESGTPPPPGRNWVPIVARLNLLLVMAILVLMVIRPS